MNSFYPILRIGFGAWLLAGALGHAENIPLQMAGEVMAVSSGIAVSSGVAVSSIPAVAVEPYVCPLAKCTVLSHFGARTMTGKTVSERHEGVDLRADPGQTVRAARSGKVIFAGFTKAYISRASKTDQQRLIIVRHVEGQSSRYVHLNTLAVRPPQEVKAGDILGTTAVSDEWTEPVLHFEIRAINGSPLNPEKYLKKR